MQRRDFLILTAAVTLALPGRARAAGEPYEPATCAAQGRVLAALKVENPDYLARIRFIDVDWDRWGTGDLARALNVTRRSTLIALKGEREVGRLVAQTGREQIKALLDAALAAA